MARQPRNTPLEDKMQELFVDYINKARALCPKDMDITDVDSEVSLTAHRLLNLFDKERTSG